LCGGDALLLLGNPTTALFHQTSEVCLNGFVGTLRGRREPRQLRVVLDPTFGLK
jgi:hypothetical protein